MSPWQAALSENRIQHVLSFTQNLVVPKTSDHEPLRPKPAVTQNVVMAFDMLRTIALDDKAMFEAGKVGDVGPDGDLTTPLRRLQPPIPQETPQRPFSVCGLRAHRASARFGGWRNATMMNRHDLLMLSLA
jgi:hypothetical protein